MSEPQDAVALDPAGKIVDAPPETAIARRVEVDVASRAVGGLIPRNLEELGALSKIIADSGIAPKDFKTKESIAVVIQMGLEVGLPPMCALQNIALINFKPSVYGDAALGLVRGSGLLDDFAETPIMDGERVIGYQCIARRKGQTAPICHTFTIADAQTAGLWAKGGPWKNYPQRMLQMRARSWVLRDGFPDVLKGLSIREEAQDIPVVRIASLPAPPDPAAVQGQGKAPDREVKPSASDPAPTPAPVEEPKAEAPPPVERQEVTLNSGVQVSEDPDGQPVVRQFDGSRWRFRAATLAELTERESILDGTPMGGPEKPSDAPADSTPAGEPPAPANGSPATGEGLFDEPPEVSDLPLQDQRAQFKANIREMLDASEQARTAFPAILKECGLTEAGWGRGGLGSMKVLHARLTEVLKGQEATE